MTGESESTPTYLTTLRSVYEAQVVIQLLEGMGIPALTKKRKANRYDLVFDAFGLNVGACDLFVPESSLQAARAVLEESRAAGELMEKGEWPDLEEEEEEEPEPSGQ